MPTKIKKKTQLYINQMIDKILSLINCIVICNPMFLEEETLFCNQRLSFFVLKINCIRII